MWGFLVCFFPFFFPNFLPSSFFLVCSLFPKFSSTADFFIGFSSLLLLPRQTLSQIKPEHAFPLLVCRSSCQLLAAQVAGLGTCVLGISGGSWGGCSSSPALGRSVGAACPYRPPALRTLQTPTWTVPCLCHQTVFFLPSLCLKPAIQSNYLLSFLLAAVFYTLADCCHVSPKSLPSLSPDTVLTGQVL